MAANKALIASNKDDRGFREKYRGKGALYAHQIPQKDYAMNNQIANNPKKIGQNLQDEILDKVWIYNGSITDKDLIEDVDAIVNPANECLWTHGSGVCGAIFKACGGEQMEKACNAITSKTDDNRIPTGQTAVTLAFKLGLLYILHTVAPCEQNNEDLISCYISSLELCILLGIRNVAFPCVGTGDGNFSKQAACSIALRSVKGWLVDAKNVKYKDFIRKATLKQWHHNIEEKMKENQDIFIDDDETVCDRISSIVFCCFDKENWDLYKESISKIYPLSNKYGSSDKYSYLWVEKMRLNEYQHEVSSYLHRIQSLEMENKQLRSNDNEETKEDNEMIGTTQKYASCNIERLCEEFEEQMDDFEQEYTEEKISEIIKKSPQDLIEINKVVSKMEKCLNKLKERTDSTINCVEKIKSYLAKNAIPNAKNYEQWNIDEITMFIMSVDSGKFMPYIDQIRNGLIASEINRGDVLPELTRSDLSVPPFSINSFAIKKGLIDHFQSLKNGDFKFEEGDDDNDTSKTH